jgi:hypothetical protein
MSTVEATIRHLPPNAARLLAVEVLLADPEALGDDVLESCLYILRDRLQSMGVGQEVLLLTPSDPACAEGRARA